jgi:hypothetical protein
VYDTDGVRKGWQTTGAGSRQHPSDFILIRRRELQASEDLKSGHVTVPIGIGNRREELLIQTMPSPKVHQRVDDTFLRDKQP